MSGIIAGFDNFRITQEGIVYNRTTGKQQKQYISTNGYLSVSLGPKRVCKHIHRLLAEAFLPNPNALRVVHHKDHNKLNNGLTNLEWSSYSNNTKQSYLHGRKRGFKITDNMRDKILASIGEIKVSYWARKFNVGERHIRKIITGESRRIFV